MTLGPDGYDQMTNNVVTQAGMKKLNGPPDDLVKLARAGISFTPIKKITWGFGFGCLSMVVAAIIQH